MFIQLIMMLLILENNKYSDHFHNETMNGKINEQKIKSTFFWGSVNDNFVFLVKKQKGITFL